ncbi:DEAD/DEAH box helicase family protein, partial [bacterium]|nr:DEAD/DEAH box helicase family protein [bacterium]
MSEISESTLEETALQWFEELSYDTKFGPDIAFDGTAPERAEAANYSDVVLVDRLRRAITAINPNIPESAIDDVIRKVTRTEYPSLIENNRRFHRMLTDGVDVSYMQDGREVHDKVWLLDLNDLSNNDWLAVNQFTVIEGQKNRRPDVVVFVNGLPLAVIELKNPADEKATIRHAYNQLQTYKQDIPSLFTYNELLVISDGMQARVGTLTAGWDRFMPWRTIDGNDLYREPGNDRQTDGIVQPGLETVNKGLFNKKRLLDQILNFTVLEDDGAVIVKKTAAYHQHYAVNKAVDCTLSACGIKSESGQLYTGFLEAEKADPFVKEPRPKYDQDKQKFGDHRIGVIWHTQGSGKSLLMVFYAGKIIRHPDMRNPTIVVITDRNDLDDQLFGTFSGCKDLLRQTP